VAEAGASHRGADERASAERNTAESLPGSAGRGPRAPQLSSAVDIALTVSSIDVALASPYSSSSFFCAHAPSSSTSAAVFCPFGAAAQQRSSPYSARRLPLGLRSSECAKYFRAYAARRA